MLKFSIAKEGNSLSHVWLEVFQELLKPKVEGLSNLTVSVSVHEDLPLEDPVIRNILDQFLMEKDKYQCRTTAHTIFPPLWNLNTSRNRLYERYKKMLPTLKRATPANYNGLYFERLIMFNPGRQADQTPVNQLEHIICTFLQGNHRQSALQAAVFDPTKDHTNGRQRGFPCLQHVFFSPDGKGHLAVTGVYAKQHIFDRAYGNYLGLYFLGNFMAHEMGLTLNRVNCFTSRAELGKINKGEGQIMLDRITQSLVPSGAV